MRGRLEQPQRVGIVRHTAFTLIELLVVIGILAVLLGILIPVISGARRAAWDSSTTHRVQAIMTAIDNYYQANGAYPGPAADTELLAGPSFGQTLPGGTLKVTSTENLVLGLFGGLTYTWPSGATTPMVGYDYTTVGSGPLSANALQSKRYGPYADPKSCGLEPQPSGGWVKWSDPNHQPTIAMASLYQDTPIPELTDSFPDAMPILYMRAAGGTKAVLSIPGAPAPSGVTVPANAQAVWDPTQLQPYVFPAVAPGTSASVQITNDNYSANPDPAVTADYPAPSSSDPRAPHYYFTTNDHVTPRQKGGYLLIVAGKDRKFMTRDDRINGSPAQ